MKNKKILLISLGYLPAVGGSYRVFHELLTRYPENSIDVLTCKENKQKEFDENAPYKIKRSIFLSFLNEKAVLYRNFNLNTIYKFFYWKFVKYFFKYLIFPIIVFPFIWVYSCKYSLIIFGQSVTPFDMYMILFKLFSKKIIYTFVYGEEIVSFAHKKGAKKIINRFYLKGLESADKIIANSSATKSEILAFGFDNKKVGIVYPSVDYNFFIKTDKNIAKNVFEFKNKFVIISVGNLIRRKGFDTMLKSISNIIDNIPDLLYVIKGEGEDKEYLKSIVAKENISRYVLFLDNIEYDKLPLLYSASDLFVLPNRIDEIYYEQEGFGIVFLEANACGLPVIGGNSGGVKDIIKNGFNGYLIEGDNREEIIIIINKLYEQRHIDKSNYYREYIMNKFNWETSVNEFINLINN
ncbi:MAG TPA: glycosyltransferase family 4 protein [Ignavibacteria bacterium]